MRQEFTVEPLKYYIRNCYSITVKNRKRQESTAKNLPSNRFNSRFPDRYSFGKWATPLPPNRGENRVVYRFLKVGE